MILVLVISLFFSSYFFETSSLCCLSAPNEDLAFILPNLPLAGTTPGAAPPGYNQLEKESVFHEK